jgi:hypothetical protein
MRIAVIGSWRSSKEKEKWRLSATKAEFEAACHQIGRELARRQQVVIVNGESESTADCHVVRGIISVVGDSARRPLIEVARLEDDSRSYLSLGAQFPTLFSFPPSTQNRWGDAVLIQIRDADAVLIVGGMSGTYRAGLSAIVAKKPLVPIGSFGGAAAKILQSLHTLNAPLSSELNTLNGPWTSHVLDTVIRLLGVDRQPRLLVIHGRSSDRYVLTEWLRSEIGLTDLLIMQEEFGSGRSLPEKFESLAAQADGAIALATPDDSGGLTADAQLNVRARQNVWLEVGWIWGRLGRNKVMVLCKGDIEIPSDLHGLEYYRYNASPLEVTESIRAFTRQLVGRAQ